ncbi:General substrate transporter [Niveomyces insectorum RCEF 264]|uniref:Quinate transporter n=1 Tax=Niveomyces insectorum RCEF 264 TaxID=1081102 RepID=A0A167NHE0_9HYPO|nr:General substrate transporter [Niveomyces insectorum RCEF 264]
MKFTNPFAVPESSNFPREVFGYRPYVLSLSASWAAACYGYDGGFIGGTMALPSFKHAFGLDSAASASALAGLQSNIVTTFQAGAFFGAIIGYFASALIGVGRRHALMAAMAVFLLGSLLEMFAHIGLLYVGRACTGLGVGSAMLVLPIYIAEFAPHPIRGRLVAIFEVMVQIFLVIGFWVNYGVALNVSDTSNAQWRIPFALQFIPAGLCFISLFFMIESPRWLVSKNRLAEARSALAWARHLPADHAFIDSELREVQASIALELEAAGGGIQGHRYLWRELWSAGVRNRVVLSLCLMMLQQLTGINAVNYFSPIIFKELGYTGTEVSLLATGVYGIVKMVSSALFSFFIVDRFGRRPALLVGCVVMAVCMFYVGAYTKINVVSANPTSETSAGPGGQAALAMIYIYIIANSASWTSIPWIFAAEAFPTHVRSFAMMFPTCMQYLGQFVVVYSLPYMVNNIAYGTYLFYAAWIVVGFVFTYFFVAETKGATLEDMDLLFGADAPIWARAARKRYETAHAAGVTAVAVHEIQKAGKTEAQVDTVERA